MRTYDSFEKAVEDVEKVQRWQESQPKPPDTYKNLFAWLRKLLGLDRPLR